jgi:hypothetical protein
MKIHFYSTLHSKIICGEKLWKTSNATDNLKDVTCSKCVSYLKSKPGPKVDVKISFPRRKR